MTELGQQLINGVALGTTYALLALGLAMVFSVLGLVNFAHGEVLALGAYAMIPLSRAGLSFPVIGLGAVAASTVAALLMERIAFRPVRRASATTMLVTSFGVSITVQAALAAGVSPRPQSIGRPGWVDGSVHVGGLRIGAADVLTLAITLVALAACTVFFRRTGVGTAVRAAAEDFDAARLMGIRGNRVIATAFALSGALAGVSAFLLVTRSGSATPTMGFVPVLTAFVATILGGLGSLVGAVVGGLVLGLAEVLFFAYLPGTVAGYTQGLLFAAVGAVLLLRPGGILKSRLAEKV